MLEQRGIELKLHWANISVSWDTTPHIEYDWRCFHALPLLQIIYSLHYHDYTGIKALKASIYGDHMCAKLQLKHQVISCDRN